MESTCVLLTPLGGVRDPQSLSPQYVPAGVLYQFLWPPHRVKATLSRLPTILGVTYLIAFALAAPKQHTGGPYPL